MQRQVARLGSKFLRPVFWKAQRFGCNVFIRH
jgi:hypothetical protein